MHTTDLPIRISTDALAGYVAVIRPDGGRIYAHAGDYEARVAELQAEEMTTSDAQGAADAEVLACWRSGAANPYRGRWPT